MSMSSLTDFILSPQIVLGRKEHDQLARLALTGVEHTAEDADWLLHELGRARVVPDDSVPPDVVRMGSTAEFRTTQGEMQRVRIVFPEEADAAKGDISVLTPTGTALLGLRAGQSITWMTPAGRKQVLTLLQVISPWDDEDPWPPAAA